MGLPEGAQTPGSREWTVLHPGQEVGADLRQGDDQGSRDDQVPKGALDRSAVNTKITRVVYDSTIFDGCRPITDSAVI